MLNYLGPKRLMSGGGTGNDGVDAMATMSANSDELQILVYDQYTTFNTTGTDMVTVNVSNLPATLSGKSVFVTQFVVDETHSNPYSDVGQPEQAERADRGAVAGDEGAPAPGARAAGQQDDARHDVHEHLHHQPAGGDAADRRGQPPGDGTQRASSRSRARTTTASPAAPRKTATTARPWVNRLAIAAGGYAFYNVVDFSDAGAAAVQLRVNAQSATTLTLRTDSATGTAIGTCAIAATSGAWATQTCNLTQTTGVHTLYVSPAARSASTT